jgi:hypothetical protein
VLSGADPAQTLLGMVDPVWLDPEFLLAVRNIKFRGNSARVLYALDGLPSFTGLAGAPSALDGHADLVDVAGPHRALRRRRQVRAGLGAAPRRDPDALATLARDGARRASTC